jgi:S-methylmethionine-dependent homocysteine/selenocysteine methylase
MEPTCQHMAAIATPIAAQSENWEPGHSMAYAQIKQRLDRGEVLVLDGATGTELQRRGAPMDAAAWCGPATLQHHALLTDIHRDYIEAGADVVTANTFAASRLMLGAAGLGDRVGDVVARAVEAAQLARKQLGVEGRVAVAGSLSHMVPVAAGTDVVDPNLVPSQAAIADAFHELAGHLKANGVDHIMLEMMYNPARTPLAVTAALETGLPVWFGASARRVEDGTVLAFDRLETLPLSEIAGMIPATGIDVAGIMHTGSDLMADALNVIRAHFTGPLSAYPDSGYFAAPDWRFVDVIDAAALRDFYATWLETGARLIGGCCGTGLAHIRAAAAAREEYVRKGNAIGAVVV